MFLFSLYNSKFKGVFFWGVLGGSPPDVYWLAPGFLSEKIQSALVGEFVQCCPAAAAGRCSFPEMIMVAFKCGSRC